MESVIDTNVLVYDALVDSEFHAFPSEILSTIDRWLLATVEVEEFVSVMVKLGVKRAFLGRKLEEFLTDDTIELAEIEPEDIRTAAEFVSHERGGFRSFNDKLILSVAKRRGASLFTFDKELDKERGAACVGTPVSTVAGSGG